ncbi:tight adherence pilus pseudopilin TadF [Lonepinella sp. MS14437]|uniref:tight adherence pilus pseudopilin TadF n=1 Tax=Lonepinella sp. MS14437 TaxID=3003620 RepID=UPI0036DB2DAE
MKDSLKINPQMRIKFFSSNEKGSVAIEFVLIMIVLAILFAFMADLVFVRSTLGKLDNASYSLVNVLRERNRLTIDSETNSTDAGASETNVQDTGASKTTLADERKITNKELVTFKKLASQILYGKGHDHNDVMIVLEQLTFTGATSSTLTTLGDTSKCKPSTTLDRRANLSPRSEANGERKIPLYQVTVCMETGSGLFRALVADDSAKSNGMLRSTSLAVSR